MSKPRLAAFPAAFFLAGLGLSLYYAEAWRKLPSYSEQDIAASVELNLAMDLGRQNRAVDSLGHSELIALRTQLEQELRADIVREEREVQRGFVAGTAALLMSIGQLIWLRRRRPGP